MYITVLMAVISEAIIYSIIYWVKKKIKNIIDNGERANNYYIATLSSSNFRKDANSKDGSPNYVTAKYDYICDGIRKTYSCSSHYYTKILYSPARIKLYYGKNKHKVYTDNDLNRLQYNSIYYLVLTPITISIISFLIYTFLIR